MSALAPTLESFFTVRLASQRNASPNTVANNVVSPLERQFLTIEGVQSIASTSSTGEATIEFGKTP